MSSERPDPSHAIGCIFCGQGVVDSRDPLWRSKSMAHVRVCDKHPMSAVVAALRRCESAIDVVRGYVVAAERAERGDPCAIPEEYVRSLFQAHREARRELERLELLR